MTTNKAELDPNVQFICDRVATSVKNGGRVTQFGANIGDSEKFRIQTRHAFISWGDLDERVIRNRPDNFPGYAQAIERAVASLS